MRKDSGALPNRTPALSRVLTTPAMAGLYKTLPNVTVIEKAEVLTADDKGRSIVHLAIVAQWLKNDLSDTARGNVVVGLANGQILDNEGLAGDLRDALGGVELLLIDLINALPLTVQQLDDIIQNARVTANQA